MKKNYFIFVLCLSSALFIAHQAEAHQPRYIMDSGLTLINNPEISQAFYGELKGREARYLIELTKSQDLYLQLLVPDLPEIQKDKIAIIDYLSELGGQSISFAKLESAPVEWEKYYEEYAGDNYWQGPEFKKSAEAGYYLVKISSPDNQGKYVLVVGEKEEFPVLEAAKALVTIPMLKKDFFEQPVTQWFNGKIGRYLSFGLIGLLILGFMFYRFNRIYK